MTRLLSPRFLSLTAAAVMLAVSSAGHAHQLWLEQDAKGAKLYFGEFGDNLREASPGLLDKFVKPAAQKVSGANALPLVVTKTADGFSLSSVAKPSEGLIAEETAYPSFERKDGDKTSRGIYVPAARLVTHYAKQEAQLTLDLVPTGQQSADGVQIQAVFKGKPLPKAKVAVVTAAGWMQEHHTDEQGLLTVKLPWAGTYVLEISHQDKQPGTRGTEKYDSASYVTSLTLPHPTGLPALPAPPAAAPNK